MGTRQTQPHSEAQPGRKPKHKGPSEAERENKRRSLQVVNATEPLAHTAYGIEPINPAQATPDVTPQPALPRTQVRSLGSLVDSHAAGTSSGKTSSAPDVWYFMIGVDSDVRGPWSDKPVPLPPLAELKLRLSKERPNVVKYKHFCCRLCRSVSFWFYLRSLI